MTTLSSTQRMTLARCIAAAQKVMWYRAAGKGERVTLASLWRKGLLDRRVHRGVEGQANAAHEYRATDAVLGEWKKRPATHVQGKVIIQPGDRGDVFVLLPSGEVHVVGDTNDAARIAHQWIKAHMDPQAVNVALIDWCKGLQPPREV